MLDTWLYVLKNSKIVEDTQCLIHNSENEYPKVTHDGKAIYIHRFAYMFANNMEDLPKDLVVRHVVCNNNKCYNPEHIDIGTYEQK